MACLFNHQWSWPRRKAGKDMQICLTCGSERESLVRFGEPRYRKTQDARPEVSNLTVRFRKALQAVSASAN